MSGRVVFSLTEAQAAALVLFSGRGGHMLIAPHHLGGDVRARKRVFAALVDRGYVGASRGASTGWALTPSGHEVAAVARRLANAGAFGARDFGDRVACAA